MNFLKCLIWVVIQCVIFDVKVKKEMGCHSKGGRGGKWEAL